MPGRARAPKARPFKNNERAGFLMLIDDYIISQMVKIKKITQGE